MSIQNGIGISSYQRTMDARIAGSPAELKTPTCRTMINPLQQQVTEFTVGGTEASDVYAITVIEPDGTTHTTTMTRTAEDNDGIADALVANQPASLSGVGAFVKSDTNDVQFVAERAGELYDFSVTVPSGATLAESLITNPAGTSIPLARFVVNGSGSAVDGQRPCALPSASTVADDIRGIVMRPLGQFVNGESELSDAEDAVTPGNLCDVAYDGAVNMLNGGDVAAVEGDEVWVYISTSGGQQLGEAAAAADGTAQVSTIVPVVDQANYGFKLVVGGRTFIAQYNPSDGTTAVAVAIDGLYDSIVEQLGGATSAANGLGVTVTESDTELTFTTDAGVLITDLENTVWNADTEVASTVATLGAATAAHAVKLSRRNAYWLEDTPAGQVGPVQLRL